MSGYCPDCGNDLCLCKDIAAQEIKEAKEMTEFKKAMKEQAHDLSRGPLGYKKVSPNPRVQLKLEQMANWAYEFLDDEMECYKSREKLILDDNKRLEKENAELIKEHNSHEQLKLRHHNLTKENAELRAALEEIINTKSENEESNHLAQHYKEIAKQALERK